MDHVPRFLVATCMVGLMRLARADPTVLGDLDAQARLPLAKEDLQQLLSGAHMVSMNAKGSTRRWTNEPDGAFVASSDNRLTANHITTARGKWNISDDGRYCVSIDWQSSLEDWCRFIFKSGNDDYAAKGATTETEKIHKLGISK